VQEVLSCTCYGERSNVPLTSLAFWHVRKACQEILEELEDLSEVGFVKFKGAVKCNLVVFVKVEIKAIEVWNAAIHTLNHLVLEFEKSRVIERDPYVAGESGSRVVTHGPETKLKLGRL
jgi:hypothetical protein